MFQEAVQLKDQKLFRNLLAAYGARTTRIPKDQISALMTYADVGPPLERARIASTRIENGWLLANPWSQPGID